MFVINVINKNFIFDILILQEIEVDVTFLVGQDEGVIEAHKFMLISASEVFHRMLYGRMATLGSPIQVPFHISLTVICIVLYFNRCILVNVKNLINK